jgi:hypothetical protein
VWNQVLARRRLSDDQPSRTSTVRVSPITGPNGSANPIQNANSSGNSASARSPVLPQEPPGNEFCHGDQQEQDEQGHRGLDPDVLKWLSSW